MEMEWGKALASSLEQSCKISAKTTIVNANF